MHDIAKTVISFTYVNQQNGRTLDSEIEASTLIPLNKLSLWKIINEIKNKRHSLKLFASTSWLIL